MNPEAIQGMIIVAPKADTEFLTITVKSENTRQAVEIENQAAESLSDMAMALFLGIMVSVGVAFLLEYLDNTVKINQDMKDFWVYLYRNYTFCY